MKFSIITVSMNSKDTIEQTITSVLDQSYKDIEYIIIDGGSTDGTKEIIQKYEDQLAYWCSEPDKGIYDAMNKGLTHVTGDVVSFLNSDDWYEDGIFNIIADYFLKEDVDVVSGSINEIKEDNITPVTEKFKMDELHVHMICPHPAVFAKKCLFDMFGNFNVKYNIAADYDWLLRVYLKGAQIYQVQDIFTNFRMDGISNHSFYETGMEAKEVAYSYLDEKIECAYKERIAKYYKPYTMFELLNESSIDNDDNFYIWGTGRWGERCYILFRRLGLKIAGFIDSNRKKNTLYGYKVYRIEEIVKEIHGKNLICISSEKYEEEIKQQLRESGILESQYFMFRELKDIVLKRLPDKKEQ